MGLNENQFSRPLGMKNPINFMLFYFYFSCNIFMTMVLYWYFILMIRNEKNKNKLSSYFFNYSFKVLHVPWACMNLLRLVNHRNSNKTGCFPITCFNYNHFISIFDLLHYIIIGFSSYYVFIVFANSQIQNTHVCSFFW